MKGTAGRGWDRVGNCPNCRHEVLKRGQHARRHIECFVEREHLIGLDGAVDLLPENHSTGDIACFITEAQSTHEGLQDATHPAHAFPEVNSVLAAMYCQRANPISVVIGI